MMRKTILLAAMLPLLSGGCVAKAAWDVATLPVKAGAKVVDVATVSAKERDEKWARENRKAEERAEKERRGQWDRDRKKKRDRDDD